MIMPVKDQKIHSFEDRIRLALLRGRLLERGKAGLKLVIGKYVPVGIERCGLPIRRWRYQLVESAVRKPVARLVRRLPPVG